MDNLFTHNFEEEEIVVLNSMQAQCLQKVVHALGVGRFEGRTLGNPEVRRDLKEFLRVNFESSFITVLSELSGGE